MTPHYTWVSADNSVRDEQIKERYYRPMTYEQIIEDLGITMGVLKLTLRRLKKAGELPSREKR